MSSFIELPMMDIDSRVDDAYGTFPLIKDISQKGRRRSSENDYISTIPGSAAAFRQRLALCDDTRVQPMVDMQNMSDSQSAEKLSFFMHIRYNDSDRSFRR